MYLCGKCADSFTAAEDPQAIVLSRDMRRPTIVSTTTSEEDDHESGVEEEIGNITTMVASDSTENFSQGSSQRLTRRHSVNNVITQRKPNPYNPLVRYGKPSVMSNSVHGTDFGPIAEDGVTLMQAESSSLNSCTTSSGADFTPTTRTPYKVILAGSSGVGKTSIIMNYKFNRTQEYLYQPTLSSNYVTFKFGVEKEIISLQVWDTAGQERFRSMIPMYFRNGDCAIFVYDICDRNTFNEIDTWIKEMSRRDSIPQLLVLIGNKSDMRSYRQVSDTEGAYKAASIGATYYELCSNDVKATSLIFQTIAKRLKTETNAPSAASYHNGSSGAKNSESDDCDNKIFQNDKINLKNNSQKCCTIL